MWENPIPNSPRFCVPIRLAWEKETIETVLTEKDRVLQEIAKFDGEGVHLEVKTGPADKVVVKKIKIRCCLHCTCKDGKLDCLEQGNLIK